MTPTRVKKGLLAVLLIVAGYVWWGNVRLITPSGNATVDEPTNTDRSDFGVPVAAAIPSYEPPKVNPFQRQIRSATPSRARTRTPPPPKPQLPSEYELTGFLQRGQLSQAVIRIGQGGSTVLSVGDSLGAWIIVEVIDQAAVLQNGSTLDTLWLETPNNSSF